MNQDLLLLHIAQTQHADGIVLHQIAEGVNLMLQLYRIPVPPELAEALGESKVKHDALKAALSAAQETMPPAP
jgi:hypothetical protein